MTIKDSGSEQGRGDVASFAGRDEGTRSSLRQERPA
jgi:hypothetical protein